MCVRRCLEAAVAGVAFAMMAGYPARAAADPIAISGYVFGEPRFAAIEQQLQFVFPNFTIAIDSIGGLSPAFCFSGCDGVAVSFTKSTSFSGHSLAGLSQIDADVTGVLSFTGPTAFVDIAQDRGAFAELTAPVELSGWLSVTDGSHVLFEGQLAGTGTAEVFYSNRFAAGDARLEGYQYFFTATGITATPEPASIVLLGTGLGLLARRRWKSGEGHGWK